MARVYTERNNKCIEEHSSTLAGEAHRFRFECKLLHVHSGVQSDAHFRQLFFSLLCHRLRLHQPLLPRFLRECKREKGSHLTIHTQFVKLQAVQNVGSRKRADRRHAHRMLKKGAPITHKLIPCMRMKSGASNSVNHTRWWRGCATHGGLLTLCSFSNRSFSASCSMIAFI